MNQRSWVSFKHKEIHVHVYQNQIIEYYLQKKKILKAAWENNTLTINNDKNGYYEDFSAKTMHAKRKWYKIFKVLKEKNCQPRISYPVKISFSNQVDIKTFSIYVYNL